MKRINVQGDVESPVKKPSLVKKKNSTGQTYITSLTKDNKSYNQWIGAKGRDLDKLELFLKNVPKTTRKTLLPMIQNDGSISPNKGGIGGIGASSSVEKSTAEWSIIYTNLHRKVKLQAPDSNTEAEWSIRVRAKNIEGWSDFSPVLVVNGMSHPSLFDVFTTSTVLKKRDSTRQSITFKLPPSLSMPEGPSSSSSTRTTGEGGDGGGEYTGMPVPIASDMMDMPVQDWHCNSIGIGSGSNVVDRDGRFDETNASEG
jgi:hypothetical protein